MKNKTNNPEEQELDQTNIKEKAKKAALEKVKQKIAIVNAEELAEAEAHKAADAHMSKASKEKMNIFTRIWKQTLFDEYYRQKEMNRVKAEIKGQEDIYAGRIDKDRSFHDEAMKSITERFIADYDGTLSKGEDKKILNNEDKKTESTKNDIKNLIIDYAQGRIKDEDFKTEKKRIFNGLKDDELLKGADSYADNLFEIAQNAKLAIEHGAKIEELELDTNIIIGKAKSSLKTEAHFNFVDKMVDKVKKSPVGRFVNPATLALATGIAYSVSVGVGKKVMTSKLASWGTFGATVAFSTLLTGANESHRLAEERKQHGLEMAEGGSFNEGDKRREEMNRYQYQMEKSTDLAERLRGMMFEKDENGNDIPREIKEEEVNNILTSIANIEARTAINSKNKIDLISYTNLGSVEKERTDLTILTAKAKDALKNKIEGDFAGKFNNEKFNTLLEKQTKAIEDALLGGESGISTKDKAFRKYKAKKVAWKMAKTAFVGLTFGAAVQELVSFGNDHVQGVTEGILDKNTDATIQTPIEHLREWMLGAPSHVSMENAYVMNLGGHEFNIPDGTNMIDNGDGTFNIMRGNNIISDHVELNFNSSGALDEESVARLGKDGILANTTCSTISTEQIANVPAQDYIENHKENFHEIVRDRWYGNNTPMYPDPDHPGHLLGADLNEIKGQWGGLNGTGIDENGNYVLNHSHMTPEGSFQDGFSTDITEKIKDGKAFVACSLTGDTQNHVFYIPINPDGNMVVDPNSEAGKLFFSNENGHAVFKGKFAEVVEILGNKDGKDHVAIIGTLQGEGNNFIEDTISGTEEIVINNLATPVDVEMPYFIPLSGRKPLEKIVAGKKEDKKANDKKAPTKVEKIKDEDKTNDKKESQEIKEVSREEYIAMQDDLKMINKRIQESKGIITVALSDFKSEYGKKRYTDLKSIGEGVPVRFNKTELDTIGNEIENILSKVTVKKEQGKSDSVENPEQVKESLVNIDSSDNSDNKDKKSAIIYDQYGVKINKEKVDILGADGKPINSKKEKVEIVDKNGNIIKKEEPQQKINETPNSETKKEPDQTNIESNNKIFKIEDLSKVGTELEDSFYLYKVTEVEEPFLGIGKTKIKLDVTDKKTGKVSKMESNKKALKEEIEKNRIKITKVLN